MGVGCRVCGRDMDVECGGGWGGGGVGGRIRVGVAGGMAGAGCRYGLGCWV